MSRDGNIDDMARRKSSDPVGSASRFPYSVLWEEFGELWEGFARPGMGAAKFERLLADCAVAGHPMPVAVTPTAIGELLVPLNLEPAQQQLLADRLYGFAAEYLIPQVRKALRRTPIQTERRLIQLARKAMAFANALEGFDIDVEIVLGLLRPPVENPAKPEPALFHFDQLASEARDLAKAAELMAEEMPRHPQGTSADLLVTRWVLASVREIESTAKGRIEVLQADTAGRNPRPKSTTAKVLFAYLHLVDPGIADATKVRLILGFNEPSRKAEKMWARHLQANV